MLWHSHPHLLLHLLLYPVFLSPPRHVALPPHLIRPSIASHMADLPAHPPLIPTYHAVLDAVKNVLRPPRRLHYRCRMPLYPSQHPLPGPLQLRHRPFRKVHQPRSPMNRGILSTMMNALRPLVHIRHLHRRRQTLLCPSQHPCRLHHRRQTLLCSSQHPCHLRHRRQTLIYPSHHPSPAPSQLRHQFLQKTHPLCQPTNRTTLSATMKVPRLPCHIRLPHLRCQMPPYSVLRPFPSPSQLRCRPFPFPLNLQKVHLPSWRSFKRR